MIKHKNIYKIMLKLFIVIRKYNMKYWVCINNYLYNRYDS